MANAGARAKTYKIGQAAKLLDVKPFVLRFWEGEFKDVLVPVRTPSGQRAYTDGNIATIREIKRLLYDEGLTIEGAKKRFAARGKAVSASPAAQRSAAKTAPMPRSQASHSPATQSDRTDEASAHADSAAVDPAKTAAAQRRTLVEVAGELSAIRDLLGPERA